MCRRGRPDPSHPHADGPPTASLNSRCPRVGVSSIQLIPWNHLQSARNVTCDRQRHSSARRGRRTAATRGLPAQTPTRMGVIAVGCCTHACVATLRPTMGRGHTAPAQATLRLQSPSGWSPSAAQGRAWCTHEEACTRSPRPMAIRNVVAKALDDTVCITPDAFDS